MIITTDLLKALRFNLDIINFWENWNLKISLQDLKLIDNDYNDYIKEVIYVFENYKIDINHIANECIYIATNKDKCKLFQYNDNKLISYRLRYKKMFCVDYYYDNNKLVRETKTTTVRGKIETETRHYFYDNDKLIEIIDFDNTVCHYKYINNKIIKYTDNYVDIYYYDNNNNLTSIIHSDLTTIEYKYNYNNQVIQLKRSDGYYENYYRDPDLKMLENNNKIVFFNNFKLKIMDKPKEI